MNSKQNILIFSIYLISNTHINKEKYVFETIYNVIILIMLL